MIIAVALVLVGATRALSEGDGDAQKEIGDLSERWRAAVSSRDPELAGLVSSASEDHYRNLKHLALHGEAAALQDLHPTDQLQALFFRTMLDPMDLQAMSPREVIVFAVETGMIGSDLRKTDELREVVVTGESARGRLYKFGRDDRPDRGLQYFEHEDGAWRVDLKSELERLKKDFRSFVARSNLSPDEAAFFILEARLFRKFTPEDFIPPLGTNGKSVSLPTPAENAPQEELALRIVSLRQSLDDPTQNAATVENRNDSLHHVLRVGDPLPPAPHFVLAQIEGGRAELRSGNESLTLNLEEDGEALDRRTAKISRFNEEEPVSLLAQAKLGQDREGLMAQWRNVGLRGRPQLLQHAWLNPVHDSDGSIVGLKVRKIVNGSFWHQLGLTEGDLLESANGHPLDSMDRWQELLHVAQTAQEIHVVVRRDGRKLRFHTKTVPPRSAKRPAAQG